MSRAHEPVDRTDTNGTTVGSTAAIGFVYAAVRVLSTATLAGLALFNSGPTGGLVM